jgi:two-component system OmpR family response regulator
MIRTAASEPRSSTGSASGAAQLDRAAAVRVLLVEDAPVIRDAVVEIIEATGRATVTFTTDSESAALRELNTNHYDVVVADLQLREGSGFGVLRALQATGGNALVIVLTNYASPAVRQRCAELGAASCLDKSSEFERLPALISEWGKRHPGHA